MRGDVSVSVSAAPSGGLSEARLEEDAGSESSLQEETADEMETITEERSPSPGSRRFSYVRIGQMERSREMGRKK